MHLSGEKKEKKKKYKNGKGNPINTLYVYIRSFALADIYDIIEKEVFVCISKYLIT